MLSSVEKFFMSVLPKKKKKIKIVKQNQVQKNLFTNIIVLKKEHLR